ncbi:MAG: hypothetical protein IKR27_02195 [Lachnospiraceae bacterium]|nr:hypothetical protein [Lachnospiraceae bacterium]
MNEIFKNFLFDKHIFVSENNVREGQKSPENTFSALFSLANLFGIKITENAELADLKMLETAKYNIAVRVPEPFYRNFPKSARELTKDQLLFDQLVHYTVTYGFGCFTEPGHSLFESDFKRLAFKEKTPVKDFVILDETAAYEKLKGYVDDLLSGTRPLSGSSYDVVLEYIKLFNYMPEKIASKNTVMDLLNDTRNMFFARFLVLSDVIKLVDTINYYVYKSENPKKLNLRNRDRKFITAVIDELTADKKFDLVNCYEKKALWNGLLHHIHYNAKNANSEKLLNAMRNKGNESVYSAFEGKMAEKDIKGSVDVILDGKGSGALLRNLDYILSRCESDEELDYVLEKMGTKNLIILFQLYVKYSNELDNRDVAVPAGRRSFTFLKHERLVVHNEQPEEAAKRKSIVKPETAKIVREKLLENIKRLLKNRLGKVYIDPDMARYALPLQEATAQGGFGVLTKGSRLPVDMSKKVRGFTYWEKVNDIDLSVIGLDNEGKQYEFSWRTMADNQSEAITYSGDETSGYNGGSEFFDINVDLFRAANPNVRYLIFCNNVFSGCPFCACVCRAGYMIRDIEDSGEIYEPKTVDTSFTINCDSTFAYLFALDLHKSELIWLNIAKKSNTRVAGNTPLYFLTDYFGVTDYINVESFFAMMATERVDDPADADVVVTNKTLELPEGKEAVREYDFEKMMRLMNQ